MQVMDPIKFYLLYSHAQIMMKQFWLWPIVGGTRHSPNSA